MDDYRFSESITDHARRLWESYRYVANAHSVLIKKLRVKLEGKEISALQVKQMNNGISWELAGMTVEDLMKALSVRIENRDTLAPL